VAPASPRAARKKAGLITVDEKALRARLLALPPQRLISYLAAHGWDAAGDGGGGRWAEFIRRGPGRYEGAVLRVPLSKSLADYGMRVTEVLQAVAVVESRDVEAVLEDLESLRS